MFYVRNLSPFQRYVRILAGIAVAIAAGWFLDGFAAIALAAASLVGAISGVMGFCPMCALVGWRLRQK